MEIKLITRVCPCGAAFTVGNKSETKTCSVACEKKHEPPFSLSCDELYDSDDKLTPIGVSIHSDLSEERSGVSVCMGSDPEKLTPRAGETEAIRHQGITGSSRPTHLIRDEIKPNTRETMIAYLEIKVEAQDWRAVAEVAGDLRVMDGR